MGSIGNGLYVAKKYDISREAGIVLTYNEVYHCPATVDSLLSLIARFPINDWLCQLARITCLLAGSRSRQPEWANAFLDYFTPVELREFVSTWFKTHYAKGITAVVPSDRHVGILIELAIIHSPETSASPMIFPQDCRSVFDALLMTAELDATCEIPTYDADPSAFASIISSLWLRSMCFNPMTLTVRGYYLYQILSQERTPPAHEWATLFRDSTGRALDDYFAGGFAAVAQLQNRTPNDLAKEWTSLLDSQHAIQSTALKNSVAAYAAIRCGDISAIQTLIRACEPESIGGRNLIPLLAYPLVMFKETTFPLYYAGIGHSLMDGVYHSIITGSLEGRVIHSPQHIGGVFGRLYEQWVLNLLQERHGDKLLRNPLCRGSGAEAADAVILTEGGLVVLQIKGAHAKGKTKFSLHTTDSFANYLDTAGLQLAVKQLVSTVSSVRNGRVDDIPEYYRQPETVIQPIIVTYERIPEFMLMKPFMDQHTAPIRCDPYIRRTILMSSEDIESLVSLSGSHSLWAILTNYVSTAQDRFECFHNFVGESGRQNHTILAGRQKVMVKQLTKHVGLDEAE